MRTALFSTCIGTWVHARAVRDARAVLDRHGVHALVPQGETCCGQPAWNAGYVPEARRAARHTLGVLSGFDRVIVPSGSCAAMIRHVFPRLFENEPEAEQARDLAGRTDELSAFLAGRLEPGDLGAGLAGVRVAYHHGCHALRELGVRTEPLALLEGAGATVVDWPAAEECCGFGGLFSVKLPHVSVSMADRKLDTLPLADVLTSTDAGCLMQLEGRARRRGVEVETVHLATLLRRAADGTP